VVQAMPDKIDELFSPERLRKSWKKTKDQVAGPITGDKEGGSPFEIFERLRNLIQIKFSGDDASALNFLLDDLHAILTRMFPNVGESQNQAISQADIVPAFHDVLNRIEDLVDAFEVARRRERK